MQAPTKMFWWIALIILASGLFFVVLDDEDTKGPEQAPVTAPK